jgi:uncharacterized protein (TIGR02421 family)
MMTTDTQARIGELDERLRKLAKSINVLKYLSWPAECESKFLESWKSGRPALPEVELSVPDWSEEIRLLDEFAAACDRDDPIFEYLRRTARSYAKAARMLMASGTPDFTAYSIALYGRPNDEYQTQSFTGVEAARYLLEKTEHPERAGHVVPAEACMTADEFAGRMGNSVSEYFDEDKVSVVVDDDLSSKAIAGATRMRIRRSAMFSELDFDQLYHHEALVHMATAINGRRQTHLKSMGLGAPRTTRTQEGIAVFAELMTRSIDIARLRRLALRIVVLKHALDGADFIECFRLFLEAGQDEREAYKSTERIFRGGDVRGSIVFTKDSAYLKGVMETHVLLNVAIRDNQAHIIERLFAGRMAMSDAITLGPYFESGFLDRPRYVPPWARDTRRLAATLAYSSFMMNVNLAALTLERFVAAVRKSEDVSG